MVEKLQIVAQQLAQWSKNIFYNAKMRIDWLRNELQRLTNGSKVSKECEAAKKITQEIEKLWRQEEMYWGMCSRISWLK